METSNFDISVIGNDLVEANVEEKIKAFYATKSDIFTQMPSVLSSEELHEMYKDIDVFKKKKDLARKIHDNLIANAKNIFMKEFQESLPYDQLKKNVMHLEQLIQDNASNVSSVVDTWKVPKNVQVFVEPYAIVEKLKFMEELENLVIEKEANVEQLIHKVTSSRNKVEYINTKLDSLLSECQKQIEPVSNIETCEMLYDGVMGD